MGHQARRPQARIKRKTVTKVLNYRDTNCKYNERFGDAAGGILPESENSEVIYM